MIIKNIKLENIRSYINEEIEFPEGSLMLSGDIGSGKSTILLAIEFALFGLKREVLTGDALLRNGKKKGSVELNFSIDDKDVMIKRTLKKSGDSVVQDTGIISINNDRREKSAVELKEIILNLLNYPKEMLTKKSLIYRYSVYTPQEEMKHILLGERDLRLDTLRKVFDIDKYKIIRENSKILSSKLKEDVKEFTGKIYDLNDKKKEFLDQDKELKNAGEEIKKVLEKVEIISFKIKNKKKDIKDMEDNIKALNDLRKDLEINKFKLKNREDKVSDNLNESSRLKGIIETLEQDIKKNNVLDAKKIIESIKESKNNIELMEKTVKELGNKAYEFRIKKGNSENILNSIKNLDICPTCKQKVSDEYKKDVIKNERENIKDFEEKLENYLKNNRDAESKLREFKNDLERLRDMERRAELFILKHNELEERKKLLNKILDECENIKHDINDLKKSKEDILKGIDEFKEEDYEKIKKELDILLEEEKLLIIRKSGLETQRLSLEKNIGILKRDIDEKERIKEKLDYYKKILNFVDSIFLNLMEELERKVMLRVYNDFNSLFEKWSNILIDNEVLKIKLDNEFSPKIEQNGYDIDYYYLSGGEKTAIALAYRLSLNQVINNMMSHIKTRDLLILDEPTDGFSDEQLDRIKIILDELNIKQIIIVSHETKIEGFVSNVIRIDKKEHESKVIRR
ncbi:MAG: AAA family ATPase [archaeon]